MRVEKNREACGFIKEPEVGVEPYTTRSGKEIWKIQVGRSSVLVNDRDLQTIIECAERARNEKRG